MSDATSMEITEQNEGNRPVMLFGRDIRKIPCFKYSMLYGIYSGLAAGLATFMFTSRTRLSTNVAMGSYMGVAVIYWCYCRYDYVMQKYTVSEIQQIMRQSRISNEESAQRQQGEL